MVDHVCEPFGIVALLLVGSPMHYTLHHQFRRWYIGNTGFIAQRSMRAEGWELSASFITGQTWLRDHQLIYTTFRTRGEAVRALIAARESDPQVPPALSEASFHRTSRGYSTSDGEFIITQNGSGSESEWVVDNGVWTVTCSTLWQAKERIRIWYEALLPM